MNDLPLISELLEPTLHTSEAVALVQPSTYIRETLIGGEYEVARRDASDMPQQAGRWLHKFYVRSCS